MSRTANTSAEGTYCGRAVHGVSNLSFEDLRQIEAHRAKDRPTPWAHLARRYSVNELDLRAMFVGTNGNSEPVIAMAPQLAPRTRSIEGEREARFRALWTSGAPKSEIAYLMAMTSAQMDRLRVRMGLEKRKEGAKPNGWSEAEDAHILARYIIAEEPAALVGKAIGRSPTAVVGRAHRKGWTRKSYPGCPENSHPESTEQNWNIDPAQDRLAA